MAEEPIYTLAKKDVSAANQTSSKSTKATLATSVRQTKLMARLGNLLAGSWVFGAALLSAYSFGWVELLENQANSVFFILRGSVVPTEDIVILAIDEQSISVPGQYYKTDPQTYAYLEPLQVFPYRRVAYAQVIEKLVQAGARHVAVDLLFDLPSNNQNDRKLQAVLQRYGSKVSLAAIYENTETHQGVFWQLTQPHQMFRKGSVSIGTVNFPKEVDDKVHRLASEFPKLLEAQEGFITTDKIPSFDEAVLRAAQINYPRPKGDRIYFYGSAGTFETYPFWHVIDPENWNTYLQQGKVFKDKIVLIGVTSQAAKDYYLVPAASSWLYPEPMSGVEIHANAIATLMEGKSIAQAIKTSPLRGLFVFSLVGICAVVIAKTKHVVRKFIYSVILAISWGGISYVLLIYGQLIVPAAIPMIAIAAIGLSYLATEAAKEVFRKHQLLVIFNKYKSSPVVQEIISQQDDLQGLLQELDIALSGKILGGRYKIVKVLGAGGFSETYIAEDIQLPGHPLCVVKQLKPATHKPEQLAVARRLFNAEAQTLQKLGTYNQIPQLLAYFEQEEEFYLIQEFIDGHALSQEMPPGKQLAEAEVIEILRELLQILIFVHQNGVIHRDIKPSNIIRRESDNKLILIDFGAVKEVTTQILGSQEQTAFTIGIGTKGYAPTEQCFGRPQYNSDIYAIGMIAIKGLTGIPPHELQKDADGELQWMHKANVSSALAEIISKMVQEDFQQRYQSASEPIQALNALISSENTYTLPDDNSLLNSLSLKESDILTTPWFDESLEDTLVQEKREEEGTTDKS
ncbi:MAG: CHASE2 domain-containing protein [Pelatocladus maniniholoensis HA4357-MV3]|jgi:CHASE2 domain-containing sensor protein/tRNA A-37 threonylcarbamoyl transferase component Bud32|uniref:non-specific serine/threonine protein kinase n=1 Tax=Pelatocladus maniniholoensis HA4357-MV3 TaxID=1117104 RepID=A0A9E3LUR0_9NOST|nr:CHASE2 domain-containing protein [Pelatocladus maniniholoensis HA4357-MV3]